MSDDKSMKQRWDDFRPSKGQWFWSCAGVAVVVMLVGFTVGGWVTGGTAGEMAENAAEEARNDVIASVCVDRFAASQNASAQLASIKEASSWERDDIVEEGGWAKLAGMEEADSAAIDLCAERLADFSLPEKGKAAVTTETKG